MRKPTNILSKPTSCARKKNVMKKSINFNCSKFVGLEEEHFSLSLPHANRLNTKAFGKCDASKTKTKKLKLFKEIVFLFFISICCLNDN